MGGWGWSTVIILSPFFWVDTRGHTNQRLMAMFSGLGGHCGGQGGGLTRKVGGGKGGGGETDGRTLAC